jgi:hypothetical protein
MPGIHLTPVIPYVVVDGHGRLSPDVAGVGAAVQH